MHLEGLGALLKTYEELLASPGRGPLFAHCLETIGVFDLECFTIGRRTKCLRIWRRYRAGKFMPVQGDVDTIEALSGLPNSLIDLLAGDSNQAAEEALWRWPGCHQTAAQHDVWESYRFAAILDVRRRLGDHDWRAICEEEEARPLGRSSELAFKKCLNSLQKIYTRRRLVPPSSTNRYSAGDRTRYPLFVLTLESILSQQYKEWYHILKGWIDLEMSMDQTSNARLMGCLIQDMVENERLGRHSTPEESANLRGIEVALL